MLEDIFKNKKAVPSRLLKYGFTAVDKSWLYHTEILDGTFILHIAVAADGSVAAELVEAESGEPYVLYRTEAEGAFVGAVREAVRTELGKIAELCFEAEVFKGVQAKLLIDYVQDAYGDSLEFLWPRFPGYAVWRRKDSKKWYGGIFIVAASKLGLPSKEPVEIIDLRLQPQQLEALIDCRCYFPGWHMNKKSWYTMLLDGSLLTEELCRRIDESYRLAAK